MTGRASKIYREVVDCSCEIENITRQINSGEGLSHLILVREAT